MTYPPRGVSRDELVKDELPYSDHDGWRFHHTHHQAAALSEAVLEHGSTYRGHLIQNHLPSRSPGWGASLLARRAPRLLCACRPRVWQSVPPVGLINVVLGKHLPDGVALGTEAIQALRAGGPEAPSDREQGTYLAGVIGLEAVGL